MSRKTINREAPSELCWGVLVDLEPVLTVRRHFQRSQHRVKILVKRTRFVAEMMLQGKSEPKGCVRTELSHNKLSNPSMRSKKTFFSSRTRSASSFVTPSLEACIRSGTWNQISRARVRLFQEREFPLQSDNTIVHEPVANHVCPSGATHPITVITIRNEYATISDELFATYPLTAR